MLYVADSESRDEDGYGHNPGVKRGIRIGSVKDGKVTAFIPEMAPEMGVPEGVGVDDQGIIYGGWTTKMNLRRFVKK